MPSCQVAIGSNLQLLFAFAFCVLTYFVVGVPSLHRDLLTRRFALGVIAAYACFVVVFSVVGLDQ